MKNFTVNVVPNDENGKIPVFLAGQVMVDVQQILMDIGEYLTAKELRIQKSMSQTLVSKFMLFMNPDGSISTDTSVNAPEVEGYGSLVDDALDLLEKTLDALGSGVGGYWMEDNYSDGFYRDHVIYDVAALYEHLSAFPGCTLMYGTGGEPKKFGRVDMGKLAAFIQDKGGKYSGATVGILSSAPSKSKRTRYFLDCGGNRVRLNFADAESEKAAAAYVGKGPVFVGGTIINDDEGTITEIASAGGVAPATGIQFRRLVAPGGDVKLGKPLKADISFDGEKWKLSNEDVGTSVSHATWDESVQAFHDRMIFLWTEYADESKELDGEEAEVRSFLLGLVQ